MYIYVLNQYFGRVKYFTKVVFKFHGEIRHAISWGETKKGWV